VVSYFEVTEPGYHEEGYMLNITSCPAPQQYFMATAFISISNATKHELWNNTLPGSSSDHFYYTHMYVSHLWNDHLK